jgi:hypothetical protein
LTKRKINIKGSNLNSVPESPAKRVKHEENKGEPN